LVDAFDEVEESLRQERAARVWKQTRPFLYGGIALLVGGVGVYEYMKWSRAESIDTQAVQFQAAIDAMGKQDLPAAKAALETLRKEDGGFSALAGHMLAGVELELSKDPALAAAPLLSVAGQRDDVQGDVARLKAAYLRADALSMPELEKMVAPLIEKGGAGGALARELVAAKAFASGDAKKARDMYGELAFDVDAPRGLQTRAQQMLTVVPAAPVAAPAPAAADPSAPSPATPPATEPSAP
jgi:hypothetical protein